MHANLFCQVFGLLSSDWSGYEHSAIFDTTGYLHKYGCPILYKVSLAPPRKLKLISSVFLSVFFQRTGAYLMHCCLSRANDGTTPCFHIGDNLARQSYSYLLDTALLRRLLTWASVLPPSNVGGRYYLFKHFYNDFKGQFYFKETTSTNCDCYLIVCYTSCILARSVIYLGYQQNARSSDQLILQSSVAQWLSGNT